MSARDYGVYGFFIGIAPGVLYGLWNLFHVQRVHKEAERIARDHGEIFDIDSSTSIRFNYMFKPRHFICPEDGVGVRLAKSRLLSIRRQAMRRHVVAALLSLIGAVIGVLAAVGLVSGA